MAYTITVELPEETLHRYELGAAAARKKLETFIADRLIESVPPLTQAHISASDVELVQMDKLDDAELWQIARKQLSPNRQRRYTELLEKNTQGALTESEAQALHELGEEARHFTLKKAHAYMLLKWRGHKIPNAETLKR